MLTPSVQLPLYGKRILVTAPCNYAARLSQHLILQGALPLLMPTIETCYLEDFTELDQTLQRIDTFDWIAFTSRNGINACLQRLQALQISPSVLNNSSLCAIGKDAEGLEKIGINVDFVPGEPSPQGIIDELKKIPDIAELSILVPVPKFVGIPEPNVISNFVRGLEKLGMRVTVAPSYITRALDKTLYEIELNLMRQGKIDAIAFSSTGEVEAFLSMVTSQEDYKQCLIACFGPYTAANAEKLGLNVSIVAQDYSSFAGYAEAIAAFFQDGT
ncbi:MAG: uroporphyrinogen-III synthase [Nostocaceae cyanobacterium]|nr:uroporphyrinogen-III synthase [Nostocaceae cyanobacterium]